MFDVVFKKQVHACFAGSSSRDVYLHRVVAMPFIPPVGMEVIDGDWCATVDELCWKDGVVFAFTSPDKELYDAGLSGDSGSRSLAEIVKDWTEQGWAVSSGFLST